MSERAKTKNIKNYIKERVKSKLFLAIIAIYILFCLFSAIYWVIDIQVRNLCMSVAYMAFVPMLLLAEYIIKFRSGALFTAGVLFIAAGGLLGSCFNFYTIIPFFDTVLHGMSGVLFACLGFTIAEKLFGKAEGAKSFFGYALFALCFSLAIAVVWEIFEYACTVFLGFDMMEDSPVTNINSYFLAGNHTETVTLDGISQTVIHYGDGKIFVMNGYLDLGLIDTLTDMIICTVGAVIFMLTSIVSHKYCPKINKSLIPQIYTDDEKRDEAKTAQLLSIT